MIVANLKRGMPAMLVGALVFATGASAETAGSNRGAVILDPIRVEEHRASAVGPDEGYLAPRSRAGTKGDIPTLESPQSVTVITREQMEDRGAENLTDAVTYAPGVYVQNRPSQMVIDSFAIQLRGFSAQNATYRDGTQVQSGLPYDAPTELYGLERVEVLRGPASVLYGQGEPGGLVNLVTKRPTDEPLREVGVQYGSHDHKQLRGDISDRLSADGSWRYRLTGLWQEADSHIDYVNNDRVYFAPAITWAPSDATALTLLAHYQKHETRYPWTAFPREGTEYASEHGKIPDNRYIGEPDFDRYDSEEHAVGYLLEHDFSDRLRFEQNFRYREVDYTVKDHFRNYWAATYQPDGRTLNRAARARYDEGQTTTLDNRLTMDWAWGGVEHQLLAGVDYKDLTYETRNSGFVYPASSLDVYDPQYGSPAPAMSFTESKTEARQTGLYLQDHIRWGDRWVTSLGARQDWVERRVGDSPKDDQDNLSLRAGVVYLADGGLAPYASYSESFTPQYGSDSVTGKRYEPITGRAYELGIRWQPQAWGLEASAALFDVRRQNELVSDPGNPLSTIQAGETRSRGMELGLVADLSNNLQAIASYTYQDVEVMEAGGNQLTNGKQLAGKPTHLAKLWLDYSFSDGPLAGLGIGGGVRYTGTAYTDANNTYKHPAVALVDAAVRYDWHGARFQLSVNNLTDEQPLYCNGPGATALCDYGMPRTVMGSVTYRW